MSLLTQINFFHGWKRVYDFLNFLGHPLYNTFLSLQNFSADWAEFWKEAVEASGWDMANLLFGK